MEGIRNGLCWHELKCSNANMVLVKFWDLGKITKETQGLFNFWNPHQLGEELTTEIKEPWGKKSTMNIPESNCILVLSISFHCSQSYSTNGGLILLLGLCWLAFPLFSLHFIHARTLLNLIRRLNFNKYWFYKYNNIFYFCDLQTCDVLPYQ